VKHLSPLPELLSGALLASVLAAAPARAEEAAPAPAPETAAPQSAVGAAQDGQQPAPPAPPAQPQPAQPGTPGELPPVRVGSVVLYGEEFETDPETGIITVRGNPRAIRGEDEIRATRMLINPATRTVTAEGNVYIRQGGQEFKAQRATYSFDDREGQAEDVQSLFSAYTLDARQVLLRGAPSYEARRARFSTCNLPRPHYQLYARELELYPNDRFVAKHVGIDFLGHRLITIPRLARNLDPSKDENENSLFPTFGYDSFNGPYVQKDFTLRRKAPVWLDAEAQINTFREPSGGILAATRGNLQWVGALYYRDEAENQRGRHLQVTRLPEVGLVWSPRRQPQPGQFLPHQVMGVRYPRALDISREWRLSAMVSAGYFRQHRGDNVPEKDAEGKSGGRLSLQAQGVLPVVDLGLFKLNDLRLMARQNVYDTGDAFTVLGTGIGKRIKTGNWRFSIHRFDQWTLGSTPFYFDDLELRQEWRPAMEFTTRGFNFSYTARISARNGRLFDQVFSVSKLFHCIEPRLTYRVRTQQVMVEIRIPGLSAFGRRPPGVPATTDTGGDGSPPQN
jgi:hypothetical protein